MKYIITFLFSISIAFSAEYSFDQGTRLIITHFYGYSTKQKKEVKSLIAKALANKASVLVNYDLVHLNKDPGFINYLKSKYQKHINSGKLLLNQSFIGEIIHKMDLDGMSFLEFDDFMNLESSSNVYVIGNFYGACHAHTLVDVFSLADSKNLLGRVLIKVDLSLVNGGKKKEKKWRKNNLVPSLLDYIYFPRHIESEKISIET